MLTLEHARRAVMLGLVAVSGTAAAQGSPGTNGTDGTDGTDTTQAPAPEPMPTEPMTEDTTTPPPVEATPPPQEPAPVVVNNAPTYTSEPMTYDTTQEESTLERYGIGVSLGGGVEGFTDETARDTTDVGGSWGVRVAVGTRFPIGFEASYIGSAQSIDALGLDNDAILVGNGLDGKVRVNLIDYNIQPFVTAGVGWRHYNLTRDDFNTSAIAESDDVLEIPLGVGVATKWRGFMFDARGEYRIAADEDLMPSLSSLDATDDASLHRWGVNGNVGFAF